MGEWIYVLRRGWCWKRSIFGFISSIELNDWNIDGLKSDNLYLGTGGTVDTDDDEDEEDDDVTDNVCCCCWIGIGTTDEVPADEDCWFVDNWW